jgi:hypothetical protein
LTRGAHADCSRDLQVILEHARNVTLASEVLKLDSPDMPVALVELPGLCLDPDPHKRITSDALLEKVDRICKQMCQ